MWVTGLLKNDEERDLADRAIAKFIMRLKRVYKVKVTIGFSDPNETQKA